MILTASLPFQAEGVRLIEKFGGRALLADSMGLGKSHQFLLWCERNMPEGRTALVVCPAGLKYNWEAEVRKHTGEASLVLDGMKVSPVPSPPRYVVINYDILAPWVPTLKALDPFVVGLDECHKVKDPKTIRTKATKHLTNGVKHLIAMSGTPLEIRPIELWPVLNMLEPKYWGPHAVFGHLYGGPRKTPWGWKFDGASRLKELRKRLVERCMIRRRKEDVLEDLPQKMHNSVVLRLPPRAMRDYKLAETDVAAWLKKHRQDSDFRANALTRMNVLKQLVADAKLPQVGDWAEEFLESGEKLILFCIHRKTVAALAKRFKGCAVVNGGVTGRARQAEYDRFNGDPRCRLLVGNCKAAGEGWSANSCSSVAFAEYPWNPGLLGQCIDRCYGMNRGQAGVPTSAYYLTAVGTVEEGVCGKLRDRQKTLDRLLDGVKDHGALSVLDEVIEGLIGKA